MAGRSSAAGPVVESRRFPGQCWRIRDIGGQWLKILFWELQRRPHGDELTPTGIKRHERKPTAVRRALGARERHKEAGE